MDEVCQYIRGNHARELTTAFLAEKFRFSRSYFSLQFKKYTGTTLHDYLLVCRLYQAKQLLSEGTLSVSQIGVRVGFQDTGTFIRAFRRKEKCTPLQYRKQFGS
jgi:two-component system response regulator YesN